jgi:hypothetical protein
MCVDEGAGGGSVQERPWSLSTATLSFDEAMCVATGECFVWSVPHVVCAGTYDNGALHPPSCRLRSWRSRRPRRRSSSTSLATRHQSTAYRPRYVYGRTVYRILLRLVGPHLLAFATGI